MKRLLLFLVGIFVFILWFYYIDPQQTWEGIRATSLPYLAIGYIFFFLSHGFKISRWGVILAKIKKVPALTVFKYYWASMFINNFMPIRVGELSKSLFLKKDYNMDISASMSSMVVDRFYGLVVRLIVICFIPFLAFDLYSYLKNYLIYVAGLSVVLLALLLLLLINHRYFIRVIGKMLFFLPTSWNQRLLSFLEASTVAVRQIHLQRKHILIFVLLSLLGLLAQAYRAHFFFKAVGIDISIPILIITTTIMDFLSMLPSPPAAIGTTEWYTNIIYTIGLGISKNSVASIVLITHAINLFVIAILGFGSMISIGQGLFTSFSLNGRSVSGQKTDLAGNL